jgi:hypothetical protein
MKVPKLVCVPSRRWPDAVIITVSSAQNSAPYTAGSIAARSIALLCQPQDSKHELFGRTLVSVTPTHLPFRVFCSGVVTLKFSDKDGNRLARWTVMQTTHVQMHGTMWCVVSPGKDHRQLPLATVNQDDPIICNPERTTHQFYEMNLHSGMIT